MAISKLVAKQLGCPTGLLSRYAAFTWNRRNAALNNTAFDMLALQASDRVLEVGFGGGYLIQRMIPLVTEGIITGIDHSDALIGYAQKRFRTAVCSGRLELKCATAEALPYPDHHFSKAVSVNSIFYWQDIRQGLREIHRVLNIQGILVVCFTCKDSLEKKLFAQAIQLFDSRDLEQALAQSGFQNITTATFSDPYRQYICMTAEKPSEV